MELFVITIPPYYFIYLQLSYKSWKGILNFPRQSIYRERSQRNIFNRALPYWQIRISFSKSLSINKKQFAIRITSAVTKAKGDPFVLEEVELDEPQNGEILILLETSYSNPQLLREPWQGFPYDLILFVLLYGLLRGLGDKCNLPGVSGMESQRGGGLFP